MSKDSVFKNIESIECGQTDDSKATKLRYMLQYVYINLGVFWWYTLWNILTKCEKNDFEN